MATPPRQECCFILSGHLHTQAGDSGTFGGGEKGHSILLPRAVQVATRPDSAGPLRLDEKAGLHGSRDIGLAEKVNSGFSVRCYRKI